ncbi:hypothetical protein Q1695_015990 [Nippostrongylus brasiliensis]|nr:hypothetical protein Q1695_015990 [Nippostrongylus brasiliensis]
MRSHYPWILFYLLQLPNGLAEKEVSIFVGDIKPNSGFPKVLIAIAESFGVVLRNLELTDKTVCDNIPYNATDRKGQSAVLLYQSDTQAAPKCSRRNSVEGNVIYVLLSPAALKFGSVFDDDSVAKTGDVDGLVKYLDENTVVGRGSEMEVGDRYTGVKEQVSILDEVPVPLWVTVIIAVLLLLMIIALVIVCIKKRKKGIRNTREKKKKRAPLRSAETVNLQPNEKPQVRRKGSSSSKSKSRRKKDSPKESTSEKTSKPLKEEKPSHSAESSKSEKKKIPGTAKKNDEIVPRELDQIIRQPLTSREFEVYLNRLAHFAIDYYNNPTVYNVTPDVMPGFLYNTMPKCCPENPEPFNDIYDDIKNKIMPGLTHWQHPNFFAFYPIGRCYPDLLADFITSALSVIGFSWDSCPALTEMENAMINWVGRALGFPETFLFQDSPQSSQGGGTVTESGSDAILCAVLAARQWKISQIVEEQQRKGGAVYDTVHDIGKLLVAYTSRDAHSCIEKACKLAMLRCRAIVALEENQWGLTGEQIEEQIQKDLAKGLIPCFINCTLGTSSSASSDKLTSICTVAKKYDTWLHVDAAYAGSTFIDSKYRDVAEGIENAHTINVNLSKFLLHSATLSIIWTREQKVYKEAFATTPIYLKPSHANSSDLRDWGLHLSRRFKALKVWFILRLCGVEGLRRHVNKICDMAAYFESLVDQHPNLQIFTPRNFGIFTFQYTEPNFTKTERNTHTTRLLHFMNESHKIFLSHVRVSDNDVIRVSISYERTTKEMIDNAFGIMKAMVEQYKKRKDDPKFTKSSPAVCLSAETPFATTDAEIDIEVVKPPTKEKEDTVSVPLVPSIPTSTQPSKNAEAPKPQEHTDEKKEPHEKHSKEATDRGSQENDEKHSKESDEKATKGSNEKSDEQSRSIKDSHEKRASSGGTKPTKLLLGPISKKQ